MHSNNIMHILLIMDDFTPPSMGSSDGFQRPFVLVDEWLVIDGQEICLG